MINGLRCTICNKEASGVIVIEKSMLGQPSVKVYLCYCNSHLGKKAHVDKEYLYE